MNTGILWINSLILSFVWNKHIINVYAGKYLYFSQSRGKLKGTPSHCVATALQQSSHNVAQTHTVSWWGNTVRLHLRIRWYSFNCRKHNMRPIIISAACVHIQQMTDSVRTHFKSHFWPLGERKSEIHSCFNSVLVSASLEVKCFSPTQWKLRSAKPKLVIIICHQSVTAHL